MWNAYSVKNQFYVKVYKKYITLNRVRFIPIHKKFDTDKEGYDSINFESKKINFRECFCIS